MTSQNGTGTELEPVALSERRRQAFSMQLQNYHATLDEIEELKAEVTAHRYTIRCQDNKIEELQGTINTVRSDYAAAVQTLTQVVHQRADLAAKLAAIKLQANSWDDPEPARSVADMVADGVARAGTA